ncbi:MAG: hypothetical protein ING59_11945 [Burkholderiales bacterium]|jgi:hypothetical protein|nr:hypothetical protein [Burkholderiales bacterium]
MVRQERSCLRPRRRFGLLVFCALLLAQWTLVTQACPVIQAAGNALEWQQVLAENGVAACHTQAPSDSWHKHCGGDEQLTGGSAPAAALQSAPLLVRLPALHLHRPTVVLAVDAHADANAPPLTILYCVFLV